jgi:hypothetical protein
MAKTTDHKRSERKTYAGERYRSGEGTRIVKSARDARDGYWDVPTMWVLIVSLILASIAFLCLWLWAVS